jgi:dTDP-4-dehydrorhamnose 3,5-epimerase
MQLTATSIPDVWLITPPRFTDRRGYFCEVYNKAALARAGVDLDFIQDNQSLSVQAGTVRGLHFQSPPFAQDKLVRVIRGAILDVAVDIRAGSPTFGRHVAARLDAAAGTQMLVPKGFAHGFVTLEPDTEVVYKVTAPYSREHDLGLLWCDPDLGIDWGVAPATAVVSDKDQKQPRLRDLPAYFTYAGGTGA